MIKIDTEEFIQESASHIVPISFHSSFYHVYEKLKKLIARFPQSIDNAVLNELIVFYLVATKKFLDHRSPSHLFRLILSIYTMQRKLLRSATFSANQRHLEFRWISTSLLFPFSSKPAMGCVIAFNAMDKYELFDEENIVLALQKQLPELRLVKESSYSHTSQYKNLKIFYLEIEKREGVPLSLQEQCLLKNNIEEKVKNSIQMLSPALFIGNNEEEIYRNILVLSQEIQTLQDLPQACINLDQQTGKEIVFRITLVYISPFHRFSLKDCFPNCTFVSQRILTVKQLDDYPIEAHIFHLHLAREASLLRSDGSLDFYAARAKASTLIKAAIGEFRDYNGGIIIKQQELLHGFKQNFPEVADRDPGIMETFFYALLPLEKQAVLRRDTLATLFNYFLQNYAEKLTKDSTYSFKIYYNEQQTFLIVRGIGPSFTKTISTFFKEQSFTTHNLAYNIIDTSEGVYFNCVFEQANALEIEPFIERLKQSLNQWQKKLENVHILRIALEYLPVSLDPRIGGEAVSDEVLKLLFEGLTRYDKNGNIENGMAESIEISADLKEYIFKLRNCLWNDGSAITAYDFEYAWKKVLSPDFKTAFAYIFYPIKNAKEAKEGRVASNEVGIQAIDSRTLKVELIRPTPYFLQLTTRPLYSPVHRLIDEQNPQWPYQCEKNYPCNGPFQLKINQHNQGYQLIKNPFYWDADHIFFDQVNLTPMNPHQIFQAFQKKEIDWIGHPFGTYHSFYVASKENRIIPLKDHWVSWFVFNTTSFPFQSRKLRHAFAYAIQRAKIISGAFLSLNPAYSPLLPHSYKKQQSLFPDYDVDKARQLFNEGLQELGLDLKDLPNLTLLYNDNELREYAASCLKQQFKECFGIDCKLEALPWATFFHKFTKGNFQLGLISWTSWIDDPIYTLNAFRYAKDEINPAKWELSKFQELLDLSEQEVDPFKRFSYFFRAEKILCEEMPVIPLYYHPSQALVQKNLHLINSTPVGTFNIARSFYNKKEN